MRSLRASFLSLRLVISSIWTRTELTRPDANPPKRSAFGFDVCLEQLSPRTLVLKKSKRMPLPHPCLPKSEMATCVLRCGR